MARESSSLLNLLKTILPASMSCFIFRKSLSASPVIVTSYERDTNRIGTKVTGPVEIINFTFTIKASRSAQP